MIMFPTLDLCGLGGPPPLQRDPIGIAIPSPIPTVSRYHRDHSDGLPPQVGPHLCHKIHKVLGCLSGSNLIEIHMQKA